MPTTPKRPILIREGGAGRGGGTFVFLVLRVEKVLRSVSNLRLTFPLACVPT